jgi:hypothetical protein
MKMKFINYPQSDTIFSNNYLQSMTYRDVFTLTFLQKTGKFTLTSLHFLGLQNTKTLASKEFTLLNLPFYLVHCLERELDKIM